MAYLPSFFPEALPASRQKEGRNHIQETSRKVGRKEGSNDW